MEKRTDLVRDRMRATFACACGASVELGTDALRRWASCNAALAERGEPELLAHEVAVCRDCYAKRQARLDELDQLAHRELLDVAHDLNAGKHVEQERIAHVLRGPFGPQLQIKLTAMKLTTNREPAPPKSKWKRLDKPGGNR